MCFYHDIDFWSDNSLVYPKETLFCSYLLDHPRTRSRRLLFYLLGEHRKVSFLMMRFHRKFEEIILTRYPRKTENEIETEANETKRNNNEVAIGNKLSECYLMLRCASRTILGLTKQIRMMENLLRKIN